MKRFRPSRRAGIALVLVLAFLVLITVLATAFFSSVSTELTGAKSYAAGISNRQLSDFAVQIVQAQINTATTSGTSTTWCSQPGLIRTFNNAGTASASFKLYSSGTMQITGALNPASSGDVSAAWYSSPALYADLNAPVVASSGTVWPILDPRGLSSSGAANAPQGAVISGSAPLGALRGTPNPAPMPVQWLYVLRDSSVISPDATTTTVATFANSAKKPSADNPIVGRIAFWTDDETCKVNVNTASEGTYWDIPRFYNVIDQNLGTCQPVKNEFQSYPGHPAGISLSSVFPSLATGTDAATAYAPFYRIAPRIQPGGSYNGTVVSSTNSAAVSLDGDRLFENENELIFSPNRNTNETLTPAAVQQANFFITAHNRAPEVTLFGTPKIACWPIHADLAANPASPYASAFDRLIARCATINGDRYYFQRQNKNSPSFDYTNIARNQDLYGYLQKLMAAPVPGFGGKLTDQFGTDSDQILTEIFEYIRCTNLEDLNLTGSNYQYGAGATAYGYGKNQVTPIVINNTRGFGRIPTITEAALWIICTADPTVSATSKGVTTTSTSTTVYVSNTSSNLTLASGTSNGATLLTSATDGSTKQIRVEAALMLDPFSPMHGTMLSHPDVSITVAGLDTWSLSGNADGGPSGLGFPAKANQTASDAGLYMLGPTPAYLGAYDVGGYLGTAYAMAQRGIRARDRLPQDSQFKGRASAAANVYTQQYPFVGKPITVTVNQTNPQLSFNGGDITLYIQQNNTSTGSPQDLQQLKIHFPSATFKAPTISGTAPAFWTFQAGGCGVPVSTVTITKTGTSTATLASGTSGRFSISTKTPTVDTNNDVLLSVVAAQPDSSGKVQTLDPRFLAMTGTDTGSLFAPHPFFTTGTTFANTLVADPISGMPYCYYRNNPNQGTLAALGGKQQPFRYWPAPKVPYEAKAATQNGDWDNGFGNLADGGFVNEPDQGNIDSSWATPYYSNHFALTTNFTSPSRMMPSPGMFGSLPTGFKRGQGWQTLLFRRQPGHPDYNAGNGGFINNPDYLLLDLFWMPVVEPYAISDVLSTSGKINMNYQIIPFNYIERSTGLYAVLKHEKVISVPNEDFDSYKESTGAFGTANYRRSVQIPQTLSQFQQRFDNTDTTGLYAFRTPAEICDIHFIPDDVTGLDTSTKSALDSCMATYWKNHALTGDNSRERIYTTVYPRLTTRSNSYTVHFRAQSLQQTPGSRKSAEWVEGRDVVTGEYRGSTLIERYIDPNNTKLPHFGPSLASDTLESCYAWRVLSNRKFAP